jgi:oligopeptide/dipeptide ABC transporter ATP-binding protein
VTASELLRIDHLSIGLRSRDVSYDIVRDVSLELYENEILAIVGESGCGKSLTALSVLGLHASPPLFVTGGSIVFRGRELTTLPPAELRRLRGSEIAMVFQDPMTALDPMFTVGTLLTTAVRSHQKVSKAAAREIALAALADAGIDDPKKRLDEYPFQLSGGVSQRVMIALALVNDPRVIIADEPTTALDVTVQAQILERLLELKDERGMSIMLITHNLGVVASVADRMAVMYTGEVVETGRVDEVLAAPRHHYTAGLLGAVPRLASRRSELAPIPGRVPQPDELPPGCSFAERCPAADERCRTESPVLVELAGHRVRCHHPVV